MIKILVSCRQNFERGQDLAEYAVFVGLIALVVAISITLIGTDIRDIFYAIAAALNIGV